jgi:hypothetical protein
VKLRNRHSGWRLDSARAATGKTHHRGHRVHGAAEPQWKIPDSRFKTALPEKFAGKATNYDLVSQRKAEALFSVVSVCSVVDLLFAPRHDLSH